MTAGLRKERKEKEAETILEQASVAVRACGQCEFEDRRLYAVRLQQPTGAVAELLVCRFCFMQLTGIAPSTARLATRPAR